MCTMLGTVVVVVGRKMLVAASHPPGDILTHIRHLNITVPHKLTYHQFTVLNMGAPLHNASVLQDCRAPSRFFSLNVLTSSNVESLYEAQYHTFRV